MHVLRKYNVCMYVLHICMKFRGACYISIYRTNLCIHVCMYVCMYVCIYDFIHLYFPRHFVDRTRLQPSWRWLEHHSSQPMKFVRRRLRTRCEQQRWPPAGSSDRDFGDRSTPWRGRWYRRLNMPGMSMSLTVLWIHSIYRYIFCKFVVNSEN